MFAGESMLIFAAREGDEQLVRGLLEEGASVRDTARDGSSVLAQAVSSTRGLPLVKFLLTEVTIVFRRSAAIANLID